MDSARVLASTPREFTIMMTAHTERTYDELEREASIAIMHANASNSKKRIKASDLFKRPTEFKRSKRTADDLRREEDEAMEWLAQFEQFNELVRGKEDANG